MNRFDGLGKYVAPVDIQETPTSYFSAPEENLDPELFSGTALKGWVRNGLLQMLFDFLGEKYNGADNWATVWIAGSAVSYQWSAQRHPKDLDVLIGVDYIQFRKAHSDFQGLSDVEISKMLNEDFREHLQPDTENWNGFEVTFYVNAGATDIRSINPYAAYNLTQGDWTVFPSKQGAPHSPVGDVIAERDRSRAAGIVSSYSQSLTDLQNAQNDAARRNAEFRLQSSLMQATLLYNDIHQSRRYAFSQGGKGYSDFYNYRWQAGKKYGTVPTLKKMSEYWSAYKAQEAKQTYGIDLPDTQTLIRRAATYKTPG